MNVTNYNNNFSFKAKIGSNVLKRVSEEYHGDKEKINKFKKLFKDVYSFLDENTILDINDSNHYVLSHEACEAVKLELEAQVPDKEASLAEAIIAECPTMMRLGEDLLFNKMFFYYHFIK